MATATVENYLKRAYVAQQACAPGGLVSMGDLAAAVGVTPGTATSKAKALAESGLMTYERRGGVRLTDAGERLARSVLRRHRLIEQFLVEVVGLDWSEVHAEAEELEHAVSDKLLERIDAMLGRPDVDPHGDPIPRGRRSIEEATPLPSCEVGARVTIARVLDQSPEFLRYLDRHGLVPGASVTVVRRDDAADALTLRPAGRRPATLGLSAAAKLLAR